MRLLQCDNYGRYSLTPDLPSDAVPLYTILSHTWGPDEVVFADIANGDDEWQQKAGFEKIRFCAEKTKAAGLQYFWIDTCCINKSDSIELQIAINSMFRWYQDATQCFVYLSDVSVPNATTVDAPASKPSWEFAFRASRWFTRGWTLQELIAPKVVGFYSKEEVWLGDKQSLEPLIRDLTGIPARALRGTPLSAFPVSEREAWIQNRQTKYVEDTVYSLLGIFSVYLLPNYGEGRGNAQIRLQEELRKSAQGTHTNDFSITFSISSVPEIQHFVAREEELSEMRQALNSDGSRRCVVLHGLGGIGKTQLAVTYAKRYRDEYSAIFWFNIKDEASIQQSLTKAAMQILQQYPNASRLSALDLQQNYEEVVDAVRAWFSLPGNTRWLIIYDNYDNPRLADRTNETGIDIDRFLPTAYQGSIVITTRLSQVNIGHQIRIRKLESADDSLKILSTTSSRDDLQDGKTLVDNRASLIIVTDIDARSLIYKLDGLPLALATAGSYLKRVSISLGDYLRLYEKSWDRFHENTPGLGSYQDRTLCSTWQLSYEQVQQRNPLAAHLLQWWAYFDNEDIWFELLQVCSEDGPAWIYELTDELNFNGAMGTLHDYGFVEPRTLTSDMIGSRGYSIHSCLHSWSNNILNQKRDSYLGKVAVECIASCVPTKSDDHFWLLQRRLLSHAIKTCASIQDDHDLHWAFYGLGLLYADQGKPQEAEDMYLRALRGYEEAWGPDHTSTLGTVNDLGCLYKTLGRLQEAEDMYLRALRGKEKALGSDHPSTLGTVNNLGLLYANQGKLQKAEDMYLRALKGYEKAWGPDHTSTLDTANNLGSLYKNQSKLQEAKDLYLRALRGYEEAWGPDHTSTLDTVNNLGALYADQGKLQEAEDMYLRALRGYETAWGPDHTSTLDTVNNLGALYVDQGKLQDAEDMYIRALRGKEKALGLDHPLTLDTVNNLGALYSNQGKLQEAEDMYLRALKGYEKAIGPQNIRRYRPAINTALNLGALLWDRGRSVEARVCYQRAHNDLEVLLGPSNRDVQSLHNVLIDSGHNTPSTVLPEQTRNKKRRDVFKRALRIPLRRK